MNDLCRKASQRIKTALEKMLDSGEEADWLLERSNAEELRHRYIDKKEKPLTLLSFDVDKIKQLVFASTKPLEINGASEVVNDLTRETPHLGSKNLPNCSVYQVLQDFGLGGEHVLFAGGGTGLLLIPSAQADEIAAAIRARFRQKSISGSCSVVYRTFYPHELVDGLDSALLVTGKNIPDGIKRLNGKGGFSSIFALLSDELRSSKDEKIKLPTMNLPGFVRRCQSCGIQPAVKSDRVEQGGEEYLCNSCFEHRKRGRQEYQEQMKHSSVLAKAQSISDIVGDSDGEGRSYVAVVYADVNGMGHILQQMGKIEDHFIFSQTVSGVIDTVRDELVREHQLAGKYQAPVVGGDDILLITRASKAIPLVTGLVDKFKANIKLKASQIKEVNPDLAALADLIAGITLSVGFVVVPAHFNIRFSVEYAEIMLKQAKKGYRQKGEESVDFFVLTDGSPLSLDPQIIRERFYFNESADWKIRLTKRPLTITQFNELHADLKKLKQNVARHQLKYLQNLIYQESPGVIRLNMRYQWLRVDAWRQVVFSSKKEDKENLDMWMEKLLQMKRPDYFESNISDLMELYDFVEVQ